MDEVLSKSDRRGSSLGRNLGGVCRTEGAEAGGLNKIWFCIRLAEGMKLDSGFTFSRDLERR